MKRLNKVKVVRYDVKIEDLPSAFDGFTILQIADTHIGRTDPKDAVISAAGRQDVDLVVFSGDIIHRKWFLEEGLSFLRLITDNLRPAYGFVGILGNHEFELGIEAFSSVPIEWLVNRCKAIEKARSFLNIVGIDQRKWSSACILDAMQGIKEGYPRILLAHFPSVINFACNLFDLVLAAHTHGGQIRIPFLPFLTNDDIPSRIGWGANRIGRTVLVVSRGIGLSGPLSFRLFSPPELTLIRLCR